MAFHFKKKESPTRAARRLSRERIGKALKHLQKCDRLETVHSVRKEIKKVRATLKLVRERMADDDSRKCAATLRAAAKYFTGPRDAHVRLRTLNRLAVHFKTRLPARPFAGVKKVLRQTCLEETREFKRGDSAAAVGRLLRKVNRRVKGLKIKADGWPAIQPGLQKSYRRGREALGAALKDASPENLHQWRKHVQDLWHQLRLLCPACPESLKAAARQMKTLSQYLGDDHDLVMLNEFASRRCARTDPEEVKLLNRMIKLRQKELRSAALALGAHFYAEKPSRFCRRLENYWRAWRAGGTSGN